MAGNHKIQSGVPVQANLFISDPKDAYRQIRNYLAGRLVGATRDETLLEEVIKCLFCKLYLNHQKNKLPSYNSFELLNQYRNAFAEIKKLLPNLYKQDEELLLDPVSLAYVDGNLEALQLGTFDNDPFGDAYEAFIGSGVRGQEGQFFTPQNAVHLLISMVDPKPGERVIDPACGAGGFLSGTVRHLLRQGVAATEAVANVYGVDKDYFLANLASARLSISTLTPANIYCGDSLAWQGENGHEFELSNRFGTFDVVLTNPPFGSRIVAASRQVQKTFQLGHKWRWERRAGIYKQISELQSSVPPQVLFIERCLTLAKPGGRLGIVVPESLISSKIHRYVMQYIRQHADVRAVIGMPEELFKTSGKGGTHTKTALLFLQKHPDDNNSSNFIFMAEAKWCGQDSRGQKIHKDDLPFIEEKFASFQQGKLIGASHLGYSVAKAKIVDDIFAPRYYNPEVEGEISALEVTHDLVTIGELVSNGLLEITKGDEIGKLSYGTGPIPFVRTSDISNWEVKVDPKHCVSEEIYRELAPKQDVREGDILMVKDGTYLIGTCAFITKYDTKILFQSHLYKLRVTDPDKLSPYLLLAALSSKPVQRQIKAKRFTQDIIDSLGDRILELILPLPKEVRRREKVINMVKRSIEERVEARELARRARVEIVGDMDDSSLF